MTRLVLASASQARAHLLRCAGLDCDIQPADIDETAYKSSMVLEGKPPNEVAEKLAEQKAINVSLLHPDAVVIGADQLLVFQGEVLSKAPNIEAAKEQLTRMRGHQHTLFSAAAVARNGVILWTDTTMANLTMRRFTQSFLDDYVTRAGPALTGSVGGYHLEGLGAQLFDTIEGDYFTILGLPLLELLGFLRNEGIVQE